MRSGSSIRCSISASSRWAERGRSAALALLLLTPGQALAADPAPVADPPLAHPPRVASYTLTAKLDENAHRVHSHGSIELVNYTSVTLHELYLHLYMNAFKNDQSLFLRSPFGAGRSGGHGGKWGYVDVKRLYSAQM